MKNRKTLSRERINRALEDILRYPMTILSASMGYGKTTAVRNFLENKKLQTIWISLQESDGESILFWDRMCQGIGRFYPQTAKRLEGIGFPIDVRQIETAAETIWELDDGKVTVVVLDDYHLIEANGQVTRFIDSLVRQVIPDLHIVIISRTNPPFNRSDLLSKGLCLELESGLLEFTLTELTKYSRLVGFRAIPEELKQIYDYTSGWISAAYLLLMGLERGFPVTEITDISRLVRDNLFTSFPQETRQILMELSVLERFTLRQASKILDNPKVPDIVACLVEKNAFVEHDRQSGNYRLHNVLLDFLRDRAELTGIDLKPVCLQAGKWFLEQKNITEAFYFYWRAGKIEELLEYINRMQKVDIGYLNTQLCQQIYRELPRELIFRYPLPMLQFACTFILSGEEILAISGVEIVEKLEEHFREKGSIVENMRRRILGEIEILKILMVINDADEMIAHSNRAEELLEGKSSWVIYQDNEFLMGIPHLLYTYYRNTGELQRTVDLIQLGFPPKVFGGCGTGVKELALAEYALETGDAANALFYAEKAYVRAGMEKQTDIMMAARFVKMRTALLEGDSVESLRQLNQTQEWFDKQLPLLTNSRKGIFSTMQELLRAYLYGCLKQPERIPVWLKEGDLSQGVFMYRGMAFPCIIAGKAALLERRFPQLEAMCEGFMEYYGYLHNQLGILHNTIYLSVAKWHIYGREAGISALIPALLEAQNDGIVMPFVENAEYLLPMLEQITKSRGVDRDFLLKLITICKQFRNGLQASEQGVPQLTQREKEVLALLAEGLTQKQIAENLYISVDTAKKYLKLIYSKLVVDNKISAVQKAREAGLL